MEQYMKLNLMVLVVNNCIQVLKYILPTTVKQLNHPTNIKKSQHQRLYK